MDRIRLENSETTPKLISSMNCVSILAVLVSFRIDHPHIFVPFNTEHMKEAHVLA